MENKQLQNEQTIKIILIFFAVVLVFYLLSTLSSILLPLILALLVALLVQPLINFLIKKKIPRWLILPVTTISSLVILFGIGFIIADTASQIVDQKDYLLSRLLLKTDLVLVWLNSTFNMKWDTTLLVSEIYKSAESGLLNTLLSDAATVLGSLFSSSMFFALYYVMLVAGMSSYQDYISYVGGEKSSSLLREYDNIQSSVFSYIIIKTGMSLGVGIFTFIFCIIFGVKFAVFWGFIAFIFNFIPNIGSVFSVLLPATMAFIQLDSFESIIIFTILLMVMHFSMGNFLEPVIMGNRLRLNTPTVLFGLVFWGYIWGIPGMILSVPLLVIMKIILEKFPEFSAIGRIMGYPEKIKK